MFSLALLLSALAGPPDAPARSEQALTERTWYKVDEPPARPMWINRRGRFSCLTWPDGIAAQCVERLQKGGAQLHVYDARGYPALRVDRPEDEAPTVHVFRTQAYVFPTAEWREHLHDGLQLQLPQGETTTTEAALVWRGPDTTISISRDLTSNANQALAEALSDLSARGAVLEDRSALWHGLLRGERTRWRIPHPSQPQVVELHALTLKDALVVLTVQVPLHGTEDPERLLSLGRAVFALLTPEAKP